MSRTNASGLRHSKMPMTTCRRLALSLLPLHQGTGGATTESVNVWVWVIALADSGLPETPVAVSVTGAAVTGAAAAAFNAKVWTEPIPTVADPGATPTP